MESTTFLCNKPCGTLRPTILAFIYATRLRISRTPSGRARRGPLPFPAGRIYNALTTCARPHQPCGHATRRGPLPFLADACTMLLPVRSTSSTLWTPKRVPIVLRGPDAMSPIRLSYRKALCKREKRWSAISRIHRRRSHAASRVGGHLDADSIHANNFVMVVHVHDAQQSVGNHANLGTS
jgi:hypothetical protein